MYINTVRFELIDFQILDFSFLATMSGVFSWAPFSRSQTSLSQAPATIEIRHGKKAYFLSFSADELQNLSIGEVKARARKEAKLDDVEIKLLFQGKRLNDDDTLVKYNVRDGSRILMTSAQKLERPPVPQPPPPSFTSKPPPPATKTAVSQSALEKIAAIRQSIKNTYGAQISDFVKSPPSTRKERVDTKARLSELLLQQLLKFDDVIIDPDDFGSNEARLERKAAIKWVQGLMEQIDSVDIDIA